MAERTPAVSVVVACFQRTEGVRRLLAGLERQTFPDFEVILVDQTGEAEIEEAVRTSPLDVSHLRSVPITSTARNIGVVAARAPVVALTDDDCVPEPDWVEKITLPIRRDPEVNMVTGPCVVPETPPEPVESEHVGRQAPHLSFYQGGTNSMAFRRNVYLELGGLDPLLGPGTKYFGAEDQHLIYRFLAHGKVVNRRDAAVDGEEPETRWAWVAKRWRYFASQGVFLRRERVRNRDKVATKLFLRHFSYDGWEPFKDAFRKGSMKWMVLAVVQVVALVYGWVVGKHYPPFVAEVGPHAGEEIPTLGGASSPPRTPPPRPRAARS